MLMKLKVTFDTSVWRALGIKGCEKLRQHLANPKNIEAQNIELWETVPALFETTWDWIKDGKPEIAVEMAKQKIALCNNRIVPAPKTVIQRTIADKFNLAKYDMMEERKYHIGLMIKFTAVQFLNENNFRQAFMRSVDIARTGYATDLHNLAAIFEEVLGDAARITGIIDLLAQKPEVRNALCMALIERFDLPMEMKTHMALYSSWESIDHTNRVLEYYKARIEDLVVAKKAPRPQDYLDFEIMICGTRMDRLVTQNTNDFQKYDLPSMKDKLWTLEEFKQHIELT